MTTCFDIFQVWDENLVKLAQKHADECVFEHSDEAFPAVGENLAATSSKSKDYVGLVQGWYDEVADYNYNDNSCAPGKVCGHYTQVL